MNMPELSSNWKLVMSGLFKELTTVIHSTTNEYLGPWSIRADGRESDWSRTKELPPTVTSLSFPCFQLGPIHGHGQRGTPNQYPLMSLNQWNNRTAVAKQWDMEQSYSQMSDAKNGKDQAIYVPHVWALIAGDGKFPGALAYVG
jgi:hypothetical protein